MLKYKIISLCFLGLVYSQCEDYSQSQCNNNEVCEWIYDISYGNCGNLTVGQCYNYPGECYVDSLPGWYDSSGPYCTGGTYQIDNSYCEEIEMPECSDMNESECSSDDVCEWVEDIEIGQCSQFDNSENSCTDYPSECFWDEDITYASCDYPNSGSCNSVEGCYWDCSDYGWYCDCYGQQQIVDTECIGQYDIDNSYCQEVQMPECSQMLEGQCDDNEDCEWVEDIANMSCSGFTIETCNMQDGCFLDQDCEQWGSWYSWICYDYGPLYCSGSYESDNSYCQEVQMPECSEMLEGQCDDNEDCEWVEDIQWGNCSNYNNGTACDANDNCYWDLCYGGSYGSWSHCCIGGAYQIDNGYCEEVSVEYLMGDINNDFIINILDVIEIINLILDGEHLAIVDMNYDHSVNVLDIIILVDIILNPTRL